MAAFQQWQVAPTASTNHLTRFSHMPRQVAQVLFNRGLTDLAKAEQFIAGQWDDANSFMMKDMGKAVTRLRQAIRSGEPIAVYGDFDADGVTSTALMVETLRALGADVRPYIPHRVDEGYGLNAEAIEQLAAVTP